MNSDNKILDSFAEMLAKQYSLGELSQYLEYLEKNKPNSFPTKVAKRAYQIRKFNLIKETEE